MDCVGLLLVLALFRSVWVSSESVAVASNSKAAIQTSKRVAGREFVSSYDEMFPHALWHPSLASWLSIPPELSVGICLATKDDHPYLREWVDYHLDVLGVGRIYIYDASLQIANSTSTSSQESLVADLIESGRVKYHVAPPFIATQHFAYPSCFASYARDHRWLALIDIDEFIHIPLHFNRTRPLSEPFPLASVLDHPDLVEVGAIRLTWVLMGSNGHVTRPAAGVLRSYTECVEGHQFKSICSTRFTTRHGDSANIVNGTRKSETSPHRCWVPPVDRAEGRGPAKPFVYLSEPAANSLSLSLPDMEALDALSLDDPELDHDESSGESDVAGAAVDLYHYSLKSREDFALKQQRGDGMGVIGRRGRDYWDRFYSKFFNGEGRQRYCTELQQLAFDRLNKGKI